MSDLSNLRPREIYSQVEKAPIAWIPLGAIEWHGWHAPVGLDALTASGLCKLSAEDLGGIVLPPLHYGAYASISSHPWTVLLDQEDSDILIRLMLKTLQRLENLGIKKAVIMTGHFATEQLNLLDIIKQKWNAQWRAMQLIILCPIDMPDLPLAPDHGGLFETSLLHSIDPSAIDISQLSAEEISETNPAGSQRRDPSHPLYGIIGADPRKLCPDQAERLLQQLLSWIKSQLTDS